MSDYEYDDENNDGPKALRDHVKKLEKQLADAVKAKEELEAEKSQLAAQVKKSSLADLLKEAGIDPKFAARADRDGVEPTAESVKSWFEENREIYNFGTPTTEATVTDGEPEGGEPTIPDGVEAGVRAGQGLDAAGVAPGEVSVMSKLQSIDPTKFSTREELQAAIAAAGIKFD